MKPRRSGTSGFSRDLDGTNQDVVLTLSEVINKYEVLYRFATVLREEDFATEMKKHDAMLEKALAVVTKEELMHAVIQLLKSEVRDVDYRTVYDAREKRQTQVAVYTGNINAFDAADLIEKILLGVKDRKRMVTILAELMNLKRGDELIAELQNRVGNEAVEDMILDARNMHAEMQPQMNARRMFSEKTKKEKSAVKHSEQNDFGRPSLGDSPRKK